MEDSRESLGRGRSWLQPRVQRFYTPSGEIAIRTQPAIGTLTWSAVGVAALLIAGLAGVFLLAGSRQPVPSLRILTPTDGATVSAGEILVVVELKNATLSSSSTSRGARRYDLIYYRDAVPPTTSGKPAQTTAGSSGRRSSNSYVWKLTGGGKHTLSVQLVNLDGTPLARPVVSTVTVDIPLPPAAPLPPASSTPISPSNPKG